MSARLALLRLCCPLLLLVHAGPAQNPTPDTSVPTLHVGTSLTLVDVIAEQSPTKLHNRQILTTLKQTDFRLFDNDREAPLRSFDVGAEQTTRPIVLWLIVQCNMGVPVDWSSEWLRGKTDLLKPALDALDPHDVVGVAHWCDDGEAKIDRPASPNGIKSLAAVETVLQGRPKVGQDRLGEIALQQLIQLVLSTTAGMSPRRLPVFLFLYGDHSATYVEEANEIIQSLLESSGIVFGLDNAGGEVLLPGNFNALGQVNNLIHHYAAETGGQYLSASEPTHLASALAYILTQLHLRYVLGFEPTRRDGKRHTLRVELTKTARKQYGDPDLRFRTEYIPTPPARP